MEAREIRKISPIDSQRHFKAGISDLLKAGTEYSKARLRNSSFKILKFGVRGMRSVYIGYIYMASVCGCKGHKGDNKLKEHGRTDV